MMTPATRPTADRPGGPPRDPLTVYFDGDCPICAREIALLRRLDRARRLRVVDFAAPTYDPEQTGLAREDLGRVIHARWADGSLLVGVDVFRAVWSAVGWGWLARLSRLPVIDRLVVRGYEWFARNRLRLTGRAAARELRQGSTGDRGIRSCSRCRGQRQAG